MSAANCVESVSESESLRHVIQKEGRFSEFCLCVRVQRGRHIAHKFESGWEAGVNKAFDKKGPDAGKFGEV